MMRDIKRIRKATNNSKIITKNEWMIAALHELENSIKQENEEKPI
jgi:hypothetical protein